MKYIKDFQLRMTKKGTINTEVIRKHLIKLGYKVKVINLDDFDEVRFVLAKESPFQLK